jgi:hypothetical protein
MEGLIIELELENKKILEIYPNVEIDFKGSSSEHRYMFNKEMISKIKKINNGRSTRR